MGKKRSREFPKQVDPTVEWKSEFTGRLPWKEQFPEHREGEENDKAFSLRKLIS